MDDTTMTPPAEELVATPETTPETTPEAPKPGEEAEPAA